MLDDNDWRNQQSQLASILDFFNREVKGAESLAPIDWDSYENTIHTQGVVQNIRAKYD